MERERKDRSGNWMLETYGDSLLRLAKVTGFTAWQASASVMSYPKRVPDGMLDVTFPGRPGPDPFLIEIETYPDNEIGEQFRDDVAMVLLNRRVLPDVLLIVLFPKGNLTVSPQQITSSAHGMSELRLRIRVVNLWTIPADEILAANDVGLIPWLPLTHYAGEPAALLQMCKERIEKQASATEVENLLAVTYAMAEIRYNTPHLLSLLGGKSMTFDKILELSPTVIRIKATATRNAIRQCILDVLEERLGPVPEEVAAQLRTIEDQQKLASLNRVAADCASMDEFRAAISGS